MSFPYRNTDEGLVLSVHVTPKSSRDEILGFKKGPGGKTFLKAKVCAVPEKGKANASLCILLSKYFQLPKSSFKVISGPTSRTKSVLILGESKAIAELVNQKLKNFNGN